MSNLFQQTMEIWLSGGWAMVALTINALILFGLGFHIHLKLNEKGFLFVPEKTWRRWITHPEERKGQIGNLLDFVPGGDSLKQTAIYFEALRSTEIVPFERDLRVMKICVSSAPLLGLLGTVTGMLATFGALATGSGGDKTMGMIADGISEALVTTELGLVVAIPALIIHGLLSRMAKQKLGDMEQTAVGFINGVVGARVNSEADQN